MSLIIDTVTSYLPAKRKHTQSGWLSVNAMCCQHNGERADTRMRGGLFINDNSVSWHCFNCGFKTSWQPGRPFSVKFKKFLKWLNVPDELITKCSFEALRLKEEQTDTHQSLVPQFFDKALPIGTQSISEWIKDPPNLIIPILEYIIDRGYTLEDYNWHWTDEPGFNNRLILPFYYKTKIVGYTARAINKTKLKYISEQQPGYVFNLDSQTFEREFVILTEGPLDAVCVDGIAVMSNTVSPQQRFMISSLGKQVIVIPDQDLAGLSLIENAIDFGWSVSFPDWGPDVKDVNDACKKYGKLYTLLSIVNSAEHTSLKIKLKLKHWLKSKFPNTADPMAKDYRQLYLKYC